MSVDEKPVRDEDVVLPWNRRTFLWVHLPLVFICLAFFGLDQVSKAHVQETLLVWEDPANTDYFRGRQVPVFAIGEDLPAADDAVPLYFAFNYQYSRNKGAAFSMLENLDDKIRVPFFHIVTVLAIILIAFYYRQTPYDHHFTRYGLAAILSGALGNFADRLQHGYVIDFLDADWNLFGWRHDFAIFNIADVAINIGVICLIVDVIMVSLRDKKKKRALAAAASVSS